MILYYDTMILYITCYSKVGVTFRGALCVQLFTRKQNRQRQIVLNGRSTSKQLKTLKERIYVHDFHVLHIKKCVNFEVAEHREDSSVFDDSWTV